MCFGGGGKCYEAREEVHGEKDNGCSRMVCAVSRLKEEQQTQLEPGRRQRARQKKDHKIVTVSKLCVLLCAVSHIREEQQIQKKPGRR